MGGIQSVKLGAPSIEQGYVEIFNHKDLPWTHSANLKITFGILRLGKADRFALEGRLEKALLLLSGEVQLRWSDSTSGEDICRTIRRDSLFTQDPFCLHVAQGVLVDVQSLREDTEMALLQTPNAKKFSSFLYGPEHCRGEERGKGTLQETSTRIVRTLFDKSNAPDSELVLGEVINFPGRWSSYPPHRHPQPEIYHYRFFPENGFGFSMLGEDAVQVRHKESVLIFDQVHSQTSAPGYAMYYLWAIRHLKGNPYGAEYGTPIFDEEHAWVMDPNKQDLIFKGKG